MLRIRFGISTLAAIAVVFSFLIRSAAAQVPANLVAASGVPQGFLFAPHTPSGMVIIGNQVWVGDEVQGLHHYVPVDPANPDPINTGQFMFDLDTQLSMGGGTACVPWCGVGQIAQDGSSRAYVTSYDHTKGQPGFFGGGGVWMVSFQSQFGEFSPFAGLAPVAPSGGLAGDLPTSTALGPDGKLYVGFLKNGNIKRILNPGASGVAPQTQTVESVGGAPNGRAILSMAFLGPDLYVGTDQGLSVVRNATTCIGNAGGCGNAVPRIAGAIVAVATDAAGKVYFSANGGGTVFRYTPADGNVIPVATGFLFVGGHTNTLTLDGFGNLWIGDDTTDGIVNFTGRLWRVPAALLQTL
jgi:hypothetical protein